MPPMDHGLLTGALGAVVGLVMALTGAGGGVLAVGAAAVLGALLGLRDGIVRYRAAGLIGSVAMALAPLGVWLSHRLPAQPLMLGFSAVLAWSAWRMWQRAAGHDDHGARAPRPCLVDPRDGRLHWTPDCAWALVRTGAMSGLLTGLLGVGGGFIIVPALGRHTDLDARSIAATSLAVIALATLSGLAASSIHSHVDLRLAAWFGGAAVAALVAGRGLARRLPTPVLQRSFAALAGVAALLMLGRGVGWSVG